MARTSGDLAGIVAHLRGERSTGMETFIPAPSIRGILKSVVKTTAAHVWKLATGNWLSGSTESLAPPALGAPPRCAPDRRVHLDTAPV